MIRGRGDMGSSLKEIQDTLRGISEAIKSLNLRFEPHPDAKEFKRNLLIHNLSGGGSSVNLQNLGCDSAKKLANQFLHEITPRDSHLAILHATEVACHHPELSDADDISALDLHGPSGLCRSCPEYIRLNFEQQLNPYHCWRRGHRSGHFGFVYQIKLHKQRGKWFFDHNESELHSSPHIIANLPEPSNNRDLSICSNIKNLDDNLSGQMLVSIHIKGDQSYKVDGRLTEVQQILSPQLLVSQNVSFSATHTDDFDFAEVPSLVHAMLNKIENLWMLSGPSEDVGKNFGICVIHHDAENLVEELKPVLLDFQHQYSCLQIFEKSEIQKEGSKLFSSLYPRGRFSYGDVLVCMSLDPIIDLGGVHNAE
tara:strand:+ start:472 stop:1572 length:1101 start_codon:yes stop_codon:yes gene_type:complete